MTTALIAKLEGLSGPDREVDAEIDCAVRFKGRRPAQPDDFCGEYGYTPGNIKTEHGFLQAYQYTSSLDDARSLLPEGALFAIKELMPGAVYEAQVSVPGHSFYDTADNPAIALCIACLKAREGE